MKTLRWIPAFLVVIAVTGGSTLALAQQPPVDPANFHIFVLAGQSNMAGRGVVEAQDSVVHPRVWMLDKDLRWIPAVDPMHFDKPIAGVGPGRSFGIAMAESLPDVHIGLVPTAVGGSSISAWVPGGVHAETGAKPYDEAIARTTAAMRHGEVKGILWHQGESDSSTRASAEYGANLRGLIERFREVLNSPELPFLIGQLGRFEQGPWSPGRTSVDAAQRELSMQLPNVAYVSAEGLTDKGDALHFDAASAREFGRRYSEVLTELLRDGDGAAAGESAGP